MDSSAVKGNVCVTLVVRAVMGKHVELQLAEREFDQNKNDVGGRSDYHWRNPWDSDHIECIERGDVRHKERLPPFPESYDSVKVMCGKYNPTYQEGWSVRWKEDHPATNAFPFRFNEYLVPFAEDRQKPCAVVQYMVLYERVRQMDDGSEIGA